MKLKLIEPLRELFKGKNAFYDADCQTKSVQWERYSESMKIWFGVILSLAQE
jgi:hypothetical protein